MPYDTRRRIAPHPLNDAHAHPPPTPCTPRTPPLTPDALPPFPPKDLVLHPDDVNNKVLAAIARVLLAVNNCAMTIRDLAETCLVLGLLCHNVTAASQAITNWLRGHHRRCQEAGDDPLVLKHVLSGTRADDALRPALHSTSGGHQTPSGAPEPRPAAAADGPRETHFRRGTAVYYLSPAAGAPCPFARAGIALPPPDAAGPSRKRKRPPAASEPGPLPQRPKLLLRLPPRPQPHAAQQPSDTASDSDETGSSFSHMQLDTPFSPLPPSSVISIPPYIPDPDLDRRLSLVDEGYDSDAPCPPDSEDEDDDYHNSMLRPPAFDFDLTSPAPTAEPCTPAVKQEPEPPVAMVKAELDSDPAELFQGWPKQEESVIRIFPSNWVSPPNVIDLVAEPWRFASVSTDASDDMDADALVKQEELIAKLEPTDDDPLDARSMPDTDDDVLQPGAIPDDIVEEVSRRLALSSCQLPSLDPVAAEDFEGSWCAAEQQPTPRAPCMRRATVACLPSPGARPSVRPTRAASMSSLALPKRVVLRTVNPFYPAITATFIDGIPVYQTFLDTHRLLRRMDSDYVNVAPLLRFLRIRVDLRDEPRCVVVREGRDGVPGLWAPLELARRVALSQPKDILFPRLPNDISRVFLCEGLEAHFPPPLPDVSKGGMDRFGDAFGSEEDVVPLADVGEDWTVVPVLHDLADLQPVPLAPLPDEPTEPTSPEVVTVNDAKGPVDLMTVVDAMQVDDPSPSPEQRKATKAPAKAPTPEPPVVPKRTLRKHSQLAKLAIASIAEQDQESEHEDEDEESDLTEPEPDPEPVEKENAHPVATRPKSTRGKTRQVSRGKATAPPPPTTPTSATSGPRTRRQTEEAAVAASQQPQGPVRRSQRHAQAGNNFGALALAAGVSRKRGAAKAK